MNFETFGMKARNQQALGTFVKEYEYILEAKTKCRHRKFKIYVIVTHVGRQRSPAFAFVYLLSGHEFHSPRTGSFSYILWRRRLVFLFLILSFLDVSNASIPYISPEFYVAGHGPYSSWTRRLVRRVGASGPMWTCGRKPSRSRPDSLQKTKWRPWRIKSICCPNRRAKN